MAESKTHTVGFPLYQGCTLVDFAGATQVFAFTPRKKESGAETDEAPPPWFKPIWLAPRIESILTTEGVSVLPNYAFDCHPPLDVLFMPGGGPGVATTMRDRSYVDWVRTVSGDIREKGGWVGSVCSGAFILAAAGQLDGFCATSGCEGPEPTCGATTYWSVRTVLEMFPGIDLAPGYPRWLLDEKSRRFTGGGISSSIDLALALVQSIAGTEIAEAAQLLIQYSPDPPVRLGDPGQADTPAKKAVATDVCCAQVDFIDYIIKAVEAVLEGGAGPAPRDPCGDNGLGPCPPAPPPN